MPRQRLGLVVFLQCLIAGLILTAAGSARAAPDKVLRPSAIEDGLVDGEIDSEDIVGRASVGRWAAPLARGGQTWVSLVGYTKESMLRSEREIGGFVVVGLPLERLVQGSRGLGLERVSTKGPSSSSPSVATVTPGGPVDPGDASIGLNSRVARTAVAAAWRAAGLSVDDSHLDGIVSRARWSAILPETRLRAVRFDDERLYTDASADATKLKDSAGANLGLEARLTWRLDRLLYADDEPAFERMRLERHDARSRIAGRVLEALFHWQRASLELRWAQAAAREAREPMRTRDEVEATLRVMEAEATLDVLTSGWFATTRMVRAGQPRTRDEGPIGPPESL